MQNASVFVPLRLADRSIGMKLAAILLGTLVLAAASWIEVPMLPVPMTMQTYAVVMVGALYGWRLGAVTVLVWLGEAAIGLPVLSGGAGGAMHFWGPTAGYLFAFPVAAALVGWLAEKGWTGSNLIRSFGAMFLGHALILSLGTAWLAVMIGVEQAVIHGLAPFLLGAVLKSVLATATVAAARRMRGAGRSA